MKIPKLIYKPKNSIIFVVSLAAFAFLFGVLYTPTFGHNTKWIEHGKNPLFLPIISAIILVTAGLSRLALYFFSRRNRLKEVEYLIWQIIELVAICMFCDIFISLYFHVPYFEALPTTLVIGLMVLIYPYAFYWIHVERLDRDFRIAEIQKTLVELRKGHDAKSDDIIRFADEKGSVKFVISAQKVIYIEAAGNYVTIVYENSGKILKFSLRNTLKSIEALCLANDLLRCHRSFFVNIRRVKLLRKDGDNVFAEVDMEGVDDIPVSKMYASDFLERFGSR